MSAPKPKMTVIYSCKSNQTWGDRRFRLGDKITHEEYENLPDDKKDKFREIELSVRDFVEDLLNRVDSLEEKISALEKFVSKSSPAK